jgi:hypothetical protein
MLLPRSAIYVSLVMVTVILALVAWLILDTLSQRPSMAPRFQPTPFQPTPFQPTIERGSLPVAPSDPLSSGRSDERLAAVTASAPVPDGPSGVSVSAADDAMIEAAQLSDKPADERTATAQPGLSPSRARWNE